MRSTTSLCKDTPSVVVRDNRGLTVRNVEYNRIVEAGERQTYITRHVFDASGELQSSADPVRALQPTATPNFRYSRMLSGQPIRTESIDAGTQVQLQDARGLLIWSADSNKHRQRWECDALGRTTMRFEQLADGADESCRERFFYGDADSEARQNLRGCLIRHDDTAGCVQISSYALTGEPLNETRRFLGSLDEPNWPKDEEARETLLETHRYTTHWTYNALGELLTETDAAGCRRRYEQNLVGQLKASWLQLEKQRERRIAFDLTYNALGVPLQARAGNGILRTYEYEATTQRLHRLTAQRERDSAVLQNLQYTYDPVGNITCIEDTAQSTRYTHNQRVDPNANYQYDSCYQLLSATGRESAQALRQGVALPPWQNIDDTQLVNYTRRYTYDPGGNLIKMQHTGAQSYTLNMTVSSCSNRVVPEEWEATPEQVDSYFDSNGNLKQLQPGQPLTWNGRNQLSRVVQIDRPSNADDERYIYTSASQRVRKVRCWLAGNQRHIEEVRYLPGIEWREQRQVDVNEDGTERVNERLQVLSAAGGGMSLRLLHWEVGQPEDIHNDQARYSLDNHLGSSSLELDGQANKLTYEEYYPYGGTAVWSSKNASEAKYKYVRYSGKERDATGLYYYGYRYYAPWLGRWLNPDPAGGVDGLNLYRMVRNNPITLVDPDGLAGKRKAPGAAGPAPKKVKKVTTANIGGVAADLHPGTHGKKGDEQIRLGIAKGSDSHESEHVIGFNVLAAGGPRQGKSAAFKALPPATKTLHRQIENYAPAYQEAKEAHSGDGAKYTNSHIGTGTKGTTTDTNPATSSHAYRARQTEHLADDRAGTAIALNQRLYADTDFYKEVINDTAPFPNGVVGANDSFINMIEHTKKVPYLPTTGTTTAAEATVVYHDKFEAVTARSEMFKGGAYMSGDERKALHKWLVNPAKNPKPAFVRRDPATINTLPPIPR